MVCNILIIIIISVHACMYAQPTIQSYVHDTTAVPGSQLYLNWQWAYGRLLTGIDSAEKLDELR